MDLLRKLWSHITTTLDLHVQEVLCGAGKLSTKLSSNPKSSEETRKACQKASSVLSQLNAGARQLKK